VAIEKYINTLATNAMLNKRLLIKNLLSHNDENTFYDKKESIDLHSNEGKCKLLKHVCALSNSNPGNNSYLIIGVTDETNEIKGFEFIDDSKIQNLVRANLHNPPLVKYENIYFPHLSKNKAVGLLTISPESKRTVFKRATGKIPNGAGYYRKGSNSIPIDKDFSIDYRNKEPVSDIENFSKVSFKQLLDDVFDFYEAWGKEYNPQYLIFKDQFILCWAGCRNKIKGEPLLSEVDIRIVNEGTRIFYSANQYVDIDITDSEFNITEYVVLGFDGNHKLYPLERINLNFGDNGYYYLKTDITFNPPEFDTDKIANLYERSKIVESRLKDGLPVSSVENGLSVKDLPGYFLICYFNGIDEAKSDLLNSYDYLGGEAAKNQFECMRILEKAESSNGS